MRPVLMIGVTLFAVSDLPAAIVAQERDLTKPAVDIVQSVGCVTRDGATWTLSEASEPTVTDAAFSSTAEIEEARSAPLGSHAYVLIGVADFLAPGELLDQFQRADFTAADAVNATGSLVPGHRVLVKGLFIEGKRINLTSVIDLSETCG